MVGRRRGGGPAPPVRIALHDCKYALLRLVARRLGWQTVEEEREGDYFDVFWTDTSVSLDRALRLRPPAVMNHFPGMLALCRKGAMAAHLSAMRRAEAGASRGAGGGSSRPAAYNFFPRTFQLPAERAALMADAAAGPGKRAVFIIKPDAGCQGKGIQLAMGGAGGRHVAQALAALPPGTAAVAQHYIARPLLLGGLKFDLRVYVLVSSVDPLRVFLYREGLVRFCTTPYQPPTSSNVGCVTAHLTNYAINKKADAFVAPDASSTIAPATAAATPLNMHDGRALHIAAAGVMPHKWSFAQLRAHLEARGDAWGPLWEGIASVVAKAAIAVSPLLRDTYRRAFVSGVSSGAAASGGSRAAGPDGVGVYSSGAIPSSRCFEILGFDVLLDEDMQPWLLEANHSPSFGMDTPLDEHIKTALICDALRLVRVDGRRIEAARRAGRRAARARLLQPRATAAALDVACSGLAAADMPVTGAQRHHKSEVTGAKLSRAEAAAAAEDAAEKRRAAGEAARERWEAANAGGFERVFPSTDPERQAEYERLMALAERACQACAAGDTAVCGVAVGVPGSVGVSTAGTGGKVRSTWGVPPAVAGISISRQQQQNAESPRGTREAVARARSVSRFAGSSSCPPERPELLCGAAALALQRSLMNRGSGVALDSPDARNTQESCAGPTPAAEAALAALAAAAPDAAEGFDQQLAPRPVSAPSRYSTPPLRPRTAPAAARSMQQQQTQPAKGSALLRPPSAPCRQQRAADQQEVPQPLFACADASPLRRRAAASGGVAPWVPASSLGRPTSAGSAGAQRNSAAGALAVRTVQMRPHSAGAAPKAVSLDGGGIRASYQPAARLAPLPLPWSPQQRRQVVTGEVTGSKRASGIFGKGSSSGSSSSGSCDAKDICSSSISSSDSNSSTTHPATPGSGGRSGGSTSSGSAPLQESSSATGGQQRAEAAWRVRPAAAWRSLIDSAAAGIEQPQRVAVGSGPQPTQKCAAATTCAGACSVSDPANSARVRVVGSSSARAMQLSKGLLSGRRLQLPHCQTLELVLPETR